MNDLDKAREELKERGEFEHELLNRRVTWLLTSQTILFAAYGLSFNENVNGTAVTEFRMVVPLLGLIISFVIWLGINAAFLAKITALKKFNEKVETKDKQPLGVKTGITLMGYIPDFSIPIVFMFAWYWLI